MKVLLANKFYYRRGGDCVCTLNLEQLLKDHNHDTAVFAMQHPENLPTPWSKYFPSEIRFSPGSNIFETFRRPFGSKEVKRKFSALLDDFQPDVVHLNNIHTQLSPLIAELAHRRGIKVVWTLHDLKLLCPRYDCLRNGETICEACFTDKHKVLENKCMKNSWLASILAYKEARKWNRERLEACTDSFICPSQFIADKMIQGGFDKSKMHTLCNFIDVEKCEEADYLKKDYYCYIGRISHEKGIKTLIAAANRLPHKLVIIGKGSLDAEMKKLAGPNVEFAGFKQWNEIKRIVGQARFCVIPSECYENNPLSVIESQCLGTPVLGAQIGGIPELIQEGCNGLHFRSRDTDDLTAKIQAMYDAPFDYPSIALEAKKRYNSETYYKQLIQLYNL